MDKGENAVAKIHTATNQEGLDSPVYLTAVYPDLRSFKSFTLYQTQILQAAGLVPFQPRLLYLHFAVIARRLWVCECTGLHACQVCVWSTPQGSGNTKASRLRYGVFHLSFGRSVG